MKIRVSLTNVKQTRMREFFVRFAFGGLITAVAGWIAARYGPVIGGLFLAFPSIFPASITLIEKHEREKKRDHGMSGAVRGRLAAGADAAGAALGTFGLMAFGAIVWQFAPQASPWLMLPAATIVWGMVASLAWYIRKKL